MIARLWCWMCGHVWSKPRTGYYHGCAYFVRECARCSKRKWGYDPNDLRRGR